jgi:replication factor C subunit 1
VTYFSITGSKRAVNLDYMSHIATALTKPLIDNGLDGVADSLQVLHSYNLLREDVDSIVELCQWPGRPELMSSIEPKVNSMFIVHVL